MDILTETDWYQIYNLYENSGESVIENITNTENTDTENPESEGTESN